MEPSKEPLNSRHVRTSAFTHWISSSSRGSGVSFPFLIALLLPRALSELAFVGRNTPLGFLFSSAQNVKETLSFARCDFEILVLLPADSGPVPV